MFLLPAEINFFDAFIILHVIHRSLAQHMTLMQHGDLACDLANKCHVVLNNYDAVLAFETHEELARLVRLLVGHAGGGFIHEQQLRVLREQAQDKARVGYEPERMSVFELESVQKKTAEKIYCLYEFNALPQCAYAAFIAC